VAIEDATPARVGHTSGTGHGSQESHESPSPHGSLVDPHVGRYAARAREMVASEIRALFAVAARPEIVSLAGGMPYITALPLDAVGELACGEREERH